jgi:glycosyltransferase involved in cell wall biosynthesis
MRILVAAHNYPRFTGDPAGAYIRKLALGFTERGHQVMVLAPHVQGTPKREFDQSVAVDRFRYAPEGLERIGYRGEARMGRLLLAPAVLAIPSYLLAFGQGLRRLIAGFQPDIIHAHWWLPAGWLASGRGRPLVVTSHGSDVRLLERSGGLRHLARGVAARAYRWTAASRFLAQDIERQLGLARGSVAVTPMPVDLEHFEAGRVTPKANPPRILFGGNLLPSKGVDVLIAAVALLKDRGIACELRILGDGPQRDELQRDIETRGLSQIASIAPFVPQSRMPAEYGAATVTVLPSRGQAEGLGLALVEALLAGSAVVGTPAGGIPEVVEDNVTGLITPDGDASGLADRLARLLLDPHLRQKLTEQGAARVRSVYALNSSVDNFLSIFDAAVQRSARN